MLSKFKYRRTEFIKSKWITKRPLKPSTKLDPFIINKKHNKNEPWFKWLTRELNSYEAFEDFESGKNPRDVAEDFISRNSTAISEVFDNFDEEDKDTLDQFLKLTECEMHVFRILEKQIKLRNKVRFVDFKKRKK